MLTLQTHLIKQISKLETASLINNSVTPYKWINVLLLLLFWYIHLAPYESSLAAYTPTLLTDLQWPTRIWLAQWYLYGWQKNEWSVTKQKLEEYIFSMQFCQYLFSHKHIPWSSYGKVRHIKNVISIRRRTLDSEPSHKSLYLAAVSCCSCWQNQNKGWW